MGTIMKMYLIENKNYSGDATVIMAKNKETALNRFREHNGIHCSDKKFEELFNVSEYDSDEIVHIAYYE
jgi:hypothetical protein